MKNILIFLLFINLSFAFQIKQNNQKINIEYEYFNDNYLTDENYIFNNKTSIMIKFNTKDIEKIKKFEIKYNLKLINKLSIGYFIYESNKNTLELISQLLNENLIKTLKPNWEKNRFKK